MISRLGSLFPSGCDRKTIPKASGKIRSLGIPTVADRVVQASLKLVLEPLFEADLSDRVRMVSVTPGTGRVL